MTGRELGTSLLIGAVSGVIVVIMAAALSGAPIGGFLLASPSHRIAVSPSASDTPSPSISASPSAVTASPSARPTVVETAEPSPAPTVTPTPAAVAFEQPGVKAGLPTQDGTYGATTPIVARAEYITWRAVVGPAGVGLAVDVEVATRLDGTWTGWSKLTSRVADGDGVVVFSWRQVTPAWISVRFALPSSVSRALQGRWR